MAEPSTHELGPEPHHWEAPIKRDRFVLTRSNKALCIFVHGFFGVAKATWGDLLEAIRQHAHQDAVLNNWDHAFIGYDWASIPSFLDIADIIATTIVDAQNAQHGFSEKYTRFVLIGYSLGTLGIRQLLCNCQRQPPKLLAQLKAVVLIGSPIVGSAIALAGSKLTARLGVIPILDQLGFASPAIRSLKDWTSCGYAGHPWPTVEMYVGIHDWVAHGTARSLVHWAGDNRHANTLMSGHDLNSATSGGRASLVWSVLRSALR